MANEKLVTRQQVCTSIDKGIYKRLREYSQKTSIPISKLIDKAITLFLDKVDK